MPYELALRDGMIFIKQTTIDQFEPCQIIWWWATGKPYFEFVQWFSDAERAYNAIGGVLNPTSVASYQDERGWPYRKINGEQTEATYTETIPIPKPKRKHVEWKNGEWRPIKKEK